MDDAVGGAAEGLLGFFALVLGVLGLPHEDAQRHVGLVRRIGLLDGHEVYASVALLVPAFALFAAGESRGSD
ncbi:hypothetical protein C6376_30460 [Streptomyces sp. P3]|uniref:hypothetical protein n=1 Tax=Streptomyces sp. P3 TaxID=2135430 RepID=UPI000D1A62F2|nr:hypothetical protein [Streptomyces sp. P3]AVV47804.1 hypothetical protein C6376_30460 [Streptomyces sp. P3]